jgi:hypothetical protein
LLAPVSSWTSRRNIFLLAAIVASIVVKISLASLGHNWDVGSWYVVSDLVLQGKSVYAHTFRYNYGPIWAAILGCLRVLCKWLDFDSGEGFHILIAGFLACIDALTSIALAIAYSYEAALVFLLVPVGWLTSGFHSQFDNVAVFAGLLAWLVIRRGETTRPRLVFSALLMGLSLAIKHLAIFFPIWLLFRKEWVPFRSRILYAVIAYSVFLATFLPWLGDPASRAGILGNVFRYNGAYGSSLIGFVVSLPFTSVNLFDRFFAWIPVIPAFKALWAALMVGFGILATRRQRSSPPWNDMFLCYLIAMYGLSPSTADQYTAIPLVACAVFYKFLPSWAFWVTALFALLTSDTNVLSVFYPQTQSVLIGTDVRWKVLALSQLCILFLLLPRRDETPNTTNSRIASGISAFSALPWRQ